MKKILALLLCTALLVSLAACSSDSGATDTPDAGGDTTQGTNDNAGEDNGASSNVNMTGFPIVNEEITLSIFGQQAPVHGDWPEMDMFVEYQEMTNIKLDFDIVPNEGYDEKKQLLFASDDYPDMFVRAQLTNTDIVRHGTNGILAPLNDIIEDYAPSYYAHMQEIPAVATRITAMDGNIYALSDIVTLNAARGDKLWMNSDWLDAIGMDVPTTLDALEAVLSAFIADDPNGNGENDEIGMGASTLEHAIDMMAGSFGLQRNFNQRMNVIDGTVSTWIIDDAFKDLLMWLNEMYTQGILDPEVFNQEYANYLAKQQSLNMGLFFNQADDNFDSSGYQGVSPFSGYSDTLYANSQPIARGNGVFAISTSCENPEAALRWVDYFYSEEGSIFLRFGVEGKTWTMSEDGEPTYNDGILNSPEGSGVAIGQFTIWPGGGAPQWINDENSIAIASPTTVAAQEALNPFIQENIYPEPLFDVETNDRLLILQGDITKYVAENTAKFVKGELSFDEWDNYVETLKQIGVEEWVSIYQSALDA